MVNYKVVWTDLSDSNRCKVYKTLDEAERAVRYLRKNKANNIDIIAIFYSGSDELSTIFPGKVVRGA